MTYRPLTPIDDSEIPPPVADALQGAFDFDESPATLGDWAAKTAQFFEETEMEVGLEEMCTAESSRHKAEIGDETQHFHCVLDTLLLPFVVESQREFTIESRSPVSDEIIEIEVSRDSIEVTPPNAVMSFGVEADVTLPADDAIRPAFAYTHLCPYINAFRSREEYEQWANETSAAVTMGFPLTDGFALAQELQESPTYVSG